MRRSLILALSLLALALIPARAATPPGGYAEIVLVVADLDRAAGFYTHYAQYETVARGRADAGLVAALSPGSAGADELLLGQPGVAQGRVRLLRLDGPPGTPMRDGAHAFDAGGVFEVNARVADLDAAYRQLIDEAGCSSLGLPLAYGFGEGASAVKVKEVIVRCHDGVDWALIERVAPPMTGFPLPATGWSFSTQATITVRDYRAARHFFVDQLGFAVQSESIDRPSPAPGTNLLGLPPSVAMATGRSVGIFRPGDDRYGVVEALAFDGITGADITATARPPHRGIAVTRFRIDDVTAYAAQLVGRGLALPSILTVELAPYGRVRLLRVPGPEATWIEFFSPAS